jgi:hypothetical protein
MKLVQLSLFLASCSAQFQSPSLYPSLYPEQQWLFPTTEVIHSMPSFDISMPPMPAVVDMPSAYSPPFAYGAGTPLPPIQLPPVQQSNINLLPPASPFPNAQSPFPNAQADVPHPSVVAEEQRKNLEQARNNLELKVKELTEQYENHKKSVADQANQQIQQYAKSLEEQVQRTHQAVDEHLKLQIEGYVRTVQDYEQRLQAQSSHINSVYQQKLMMAANEQIQQEFKAQEAHARAELDEQLKSARSYTQEGSNSAGGNWAQRAHARYQEQLQELQRTMQENIQKAHAEIQQSLSQEMQPPSNLGGDPAMQDPAIQDPVPSDTN